jgi:hypothetical protein
MGIFWKVVSALLFSFSTHALAQFDTSLVFKLGQNQETEGSYTERNSSYSASILAYTQDMSKVGKHFGAELEFEFGRSSFYSASQSSKIFNPDEKVHVSGVGYNVGLAYIPLYDERFSLRFSLFLGNSAENLRSSENNLGFTGKNIGIRVAIRPKSFAEFMGLLVEYRNVNGAVELSNQKTKFQSRYLTAGLVVNIH